MRDGGNTCTPVGSGAVDDEFWALICEDEYWLDSEFAAIVSEPAESPTVPPRRLMVCADRSRPAPHRRGLHGRRAGHHCSTEHRPGRSWRRPWSPRRRGAGRDRSAHTINRRGGTVGDSAGSLTIAANSLSSQSLSSQINAQNSSSTAPEPTGVQVFPPSHIASHPLRTLTAQPG